MTHLVRERCCAEGVSHVTCTAPVNWKTANMDPIFHGNVGVRRMGGTLLLLSGLSPVAANASLSLL